MLRKGIANLFIMNFKVMKKIVMALLAVLLIPTDAFASFNIKVINKTDGDLYVQNQAYYINKGGIRNLGTHTCSEEDYSLRNSSYIVPSGGDFQYGCHFTYAEKWQRSIILYYSCVNNTSMRRIEYPKSKKFYDRDYPSKNGDRYTIVVKEKDC